MMEDASIPPWSELPPDLIGAVVTHLPSAADCARLRAVCRSWQSAMRHHGCPVRHPSPWVVLPDGLFLTSFQGRSARSCRLASFPKDATCVVGSTGSWLLIDRIDAENSHQYLLHDPFAGTTVPHPELDTIVGKELETSFVRRVLMRGGPDDVVALMTTNYWDYPFVLARSGKGASVPIEPMATLRIIDIAFLEGKFYGINKAEDFYFLDIGFGDDGIPVVTSAHRVIEQPAEASDEEEDDEEEDEEENTDDDDENNEGINDFDDEEEDNYSDDTEDSDFFDDRMELDFEGRVDSDDDDPYYGTTFRVFIIRHLVESRGKLFMVKQHLQCRVECKDDFTCKVEVFEADINAGSWMPLVGGLCGQALFISNSLIKFVPACGEMEEDVVYFMDTGDIFAIRSQTNRDVLWDRDYQELMMTVYDGHRCMDEKTFIFPPDLVV